MKYFGIPKIVLKILIHLTGWVIYYFLPALIIDLPLELIEPWKRLQILAIEIVVFYLNYFIFLPYFFAKRKLIHFTVALILVLIASFQIRMATERIYGEKFREPPPHERRFLNQGANRPNDFKDINRPPVNNDHSQFRDIRRRLHKMKGPLGEYGALFSLLMIVAVSTSFWLANQWFRNEKQKRIIENEKLQSELSFLKSQVNPHFLMNSLNSIYSLSIKKSDNLPDVILRLSGLLRYMLYDSQASKVSLRNEIDYISDFIELQKIRLFENVKINFKTNGDFEFHQIEPLLLIPFIENAFKHGISYKQESRIEITIDVADMQLILKVENTISNDKDIVNQNKTNSGVGLKNVKRRLELLYPNNHQLDISEKENLFIVNLILKLYLHE